MLNARNTNIVFVILLAVIIVADNQLDISVWYYVMLIVGYILLQTYGCLFVSAGFFVPIRWKGAPQSNAVAITFDDGPLPALTDKVLEILKSHQAQAAFFCIGHRVEKHPEIISRIHEQGHIVGNHTFLHGKFFDLQLPSKMYNELQNTDYVIENAIGRKPRFFRPPYGVTNPALAYAIRKGGYVTMGWSVRSFDTVSKEDEKLFNRVTQNLKGGDVILFHDYCEITIRILPRVLEHINKIGLKVVRLDTLMNEQPYV